MHAPGMRAPYMDTSYTVEVVVLLSKSSPGIPVPHWSANAGLPRPNSTSTIPPAIYDLHWLLDNMFVAPLGISQTILPSNIAMGLIILTWCNRETLVLQLQLSMISRLMRLTLTTITLGWLGCDDLQAGENICLSTGDPPFLSAVENAVCGP
jgi:hypothetical protein